jgi:hypothetical protein
MAGTIYVYSNLLTLPIVGTPFYLCALRCDLAGRRRSPITCASYFTTTYAEEKRMTSMAGGVTIWAGVVLPRYPTRPRGERGPLRCPLVDVGNLAEIDDRCPPMLLVPLLLPAAAPPPLASRHHRLVDCWIFPGLPMRAAESNARVVVGVLSCGRARLLCILILGLVLVVLACRRLSSSSHLVRLHRQNQRCQLRAWNQRCGARRRTLCAWRRQGRLPKRREGQRNGISCAPIVVYGQWWQAAVGSGESEMSKGRAVELEQRRNNCWTGK